MSGTDDIQFEVRETTGIVVLNRPKALNALTLDMCERFSATLVAWGADAGVRAVVVRGAGEKAFCAGGDIRNLWREGKEGGALSADFFRAEYTLNQRVWAFPKPYIALIDGFTMGGGVGVSVHGSHRVATERTVIAMPETAIGFFPDVGGSYFLPRMPGELGMYLGLSGRRLKAADCVYAGLATHYVGSARLPDLEAALAAADWRADDAESVASAVIGRFAGDPGTPALGEHQAAIDRCFAQDSVESIFAALEAEGGDWAKKTLDTLRRCSPTSLKVAFRQLRAGAGLGFDEAMVVEYRLSQACMARHDFYEGIRAVVMDKDNAPVWAPDRLEAVTPDLVEAHFAPLGPRDLTFD